MNGGAPSQPQGAGNQLPSGATQGSRAPPAPLPPLPRLPKPMSAVRYIAMMIRNDPDLNNADVELITSSDDELSLDEEAGAKSKEDKEKGAPDGTLAGGTKVEETKQEQEKSDDVDGAKMDVDDRGVKTEDAADVVKEGAGGVKIEAPDGQHAPEHKGEAAPYDHQGAATRLEKKEAVSQSGTVVKYEETDKDGIDGVESTGDAAKVAKMADAMETQGSKSAKGTSAGEADGAGVDSKAWGGDAAMMEEDAKSNIQEAEGNLDREEDKDCGLTHELVGEILMCWSMLRRLASHLTLPDLSLDTFVAAICSTQSSRMKSSVGIRGGNLGDDSDVDSGGDEQGGSAPNGGVDTSIRATYEGDVYISLLYELCSELRRRETLVPSSGALNVHTWPEALRTYLIWMAHHVYLVSVGCERDTQNERPDPQDGTEEGKRRLNAMEEEMYTTSDKLLNVADFLKHFEFSSLALSDRILVLSTLLNQLLHTGKFHQQVDQEELRASQVRYSLAEMMSVLVEEDNFSSNAVRTAPLPAAPSPPIDADEETRAQRQAERAKMEAEQRSRALDDAAKRVAHLKRIVRPSKALLSEDGTKLPYGVVELKGTKVLINGLPDGHELPPGVRRCKGTIFRTLMPGWHEVRRVDWPGAHAGGPGLQGLIKADKAASAGGGAAAGGDPPVDEGALLDFNFVCDEELRKLHQVKVKTAKLELIAEADRRCTVLTCREEPLGYDRHDRAVMRWNGYLNEVFVQDQRHRWGVYRGEAFDRYVTALEGSQERQKKGGGTQTAEDMQISSNECKILVALRKVKGYIGELKAAGGQVDAVADMMRPREAQVLTEDARRVRNGELNATPFLREEPGEITCAFTGETYNPKTHVHCPITFVTIDKHRYNSQKLGKTKKGSRGANSMPALKTWKAHIADLRTMLSEDTTKCAKLRAELEKRIQAEQVVAVAGGDGGGGGGGGGTELTKGYNDVVSTSDFEEVLKELELLPTPEHLLTWRSLAGPCVKDGLVYFVGMFSLLDAIQKHEPLALPQELASIKGALMVMYL
jgi:hypothetical protein